MSYCTSFYGSPLWPLFSNALRPLQVAWRKCVKRLWKLSIRTRSIYVAHLMYMDLIPLLMLRFVNFYVSCITSNNSVLSYVSQDYFDGILSKNLKACLQVFSTSEFSVDLIEMYREEIRNISVGSSSLEVMAEAQAIIDLCLLRDKALICDSLSYEAIHSMLLSFTA